MGLKCADCDHYITSLPCQHCGSLAAFFEISLEWTVEEIETLRQLVLGSKLSDFVGLPCAICGEVFTRAFLNTGGMVIRTADGRWRHDHCQPEN